MAFQQYLFQEWKSAASSSASFDCNICLDFPSDPVVTLCGHLFCWPCIYKWVKSQSTGLPSGQLPQCPVCKAETSEKGMVPVYGRGQSLSEQPQADAAIPPRPSACGIQGITALSIAERQRAPPRTLHINEGGPEPTLPTAPLALSHPVVGMLGDMFYASVFGNPSSLYTYPNSYYSASNSSPRLRRQELQADQSLNRVTIFLFCCLVLCFLLF